MLLLPSWIACLLMMDLKAGGIAPARCLLLLAFFLLMLYLVAVTWVCNSLCCAAAFGTFGSDCGIALVIVIERVMRLFSLISSSTLGTGYTTLGGGCICDGVVVVVVAVVTWSPLIFLTRIVRAYRCCW